MATPTLPIIAVDPARVVEEDKFYYGHRLVEDVDEHGRYDMRYVPLAEDDFLNPQHGDHFVQGTVHRGDLTSIRGSIRYALCQRTDLTVFSELKMEWPDPSWDSPAPDVSVVPNVQKPEQPREEFYVSAEGTQPALIVELTSPRFLRFDLYRKVFIYQQAGVDEYIIIDSGLREGRNSVDYTVAGYQLDNNRYRPIQPDEDGFVLSQVVNLLFGPSADRQTFLVLDADTRTRILSDWERAEAETQRAEAAHQARILAEQRVKRAVAARQSAEQRLRELEAELARLRSQPSNS